MITCSNIFIGSKIRWIHQKAAEGGDHDEEIKKSNHGNTILAVVIDLLDGHSSSNNNNSRVIRSSSNFSHIHSSSKSIRQIRIQMQVVTHLITAAVIIEVTVITRITWVNWGRVRVWSFSVHRPRAGVFPQEGFADIMFPSATT